MPPARKASTKKTRPAKRPADRVRARFEENDRVIRRITDSLDVAMKDLPKIGGNVGAGVGDLRKDLAKLLRDARRHATKMSSATRKDLERMQKDMLAAAKSKPSRGAARKSRGSSSAGKSRTATSGRKPRTAKTSKSSRATGTARKSRAGATTRKASTTAARPARATARKRSSGAAR
jgi:hypothetical protein